MSSSQSLTYGSLKDLATRSNKSIAEIFLTVDAIVMVDVSGSMITPDCSGGRTRFDLACEQLIRLQKDLPGKVGVISWSDSQKFNSGGIPDSPCGSTDMAGVLRFVHKADNTGIKLILISDGEPDNETSALDQARQFKSKIDCVFVGPESSPGCSFMVKLASLTGGRTINQDLSDLGNLSRTVKGLLT